MKHGIKLRKLQRTPSHRWALLRNLVSALLHHESIKTTLPKAKETARLAEKIITLGKKNTDPSRRAAMAFLMPNHHYSPSAYSSTEVPPPLPSSHASSSTSSSPEDPETFEPSTSLLPKLFTTLSTRYADRAGGYTRIHRFGKRQGDNAPHAILELVDGPKDLKFEMVARAVGRERAQSSAGLRQGEEELSEHTRRNADKVLRYRSNDERRAFEGKAKAWSDTLLAEGKAADGFRRKKASVEERNKSEQGRSANPFVGRRYMAGERLGGMSIAHTGLGLARGALGSRGRGKVPLDRSPRFLQHPQEPSIELRA